MDAITFDFFNTLVQHRNGSGRGEMLMAYFQEVGLSCSAWEHQVLYDVFQPHAVEYRPTHSQEVKRRYRLRLAERLFQRLDVRAPGGAEVQHAERIWELLGPTSLLVFPEVFQVLRHLKSLGLKLAVVSNWQCGLGHFCTELGIGQHVEHVIASAEIGHAKPEPEIFAEACQRLAVPAHRILHVGDTLADDYEGARRAGFQALLLDRAGEQQTAQVASIRSLSDVAAHVNPSPLSF